jgi:DNA-directed RNA polymerase specialized sigma24 family protein
VVVRAPRGIPGTHRHAGLLAAELEDTDGMNRERAETFVRLLAEAELRRVTAHPRDSAPPPDVPGAEGDAAALLRLSAVAAMLGDLPDRRREAIMLQYHAGLSEAETAARM